VYCIFISEVLPEDSTGGQVVLFRHFEGCKHQITAMPSFCFESPNRFGRFMRKFGARLEKTRFSWFVYAFKPWYDFFEISEEVDELIRSKRPDYILTVAHGRMCFRAEAVARRYAIPLITIFHDWYPAATPASKKMLFLLNKEFRKLFQASALAFPVSPQMKQKLGEHSNASVLWPIPSWPKKQESIREKRAKVILYSGHCGGVYRPLLDVSMQYFSEMGGEYTLAISGKESGNLNSDSQYVEVLGLLERDKYEQQLLESDVFLVLLPFDKENKLHFSTHFPSKLIEYAGYGKPIIIWGPEYATAVQWAKEHNSAFVVSSENVEEFKATLSRVCRDSGNKLVIENMRRFYEQNWHPDILQKKFTGELMRLIKSTPNCSPCH